MRRDRRSYEAAKRAIDVLVACALLLLLWPVMAVVAVVVRVALGSPVIFRQERPGKGGQIFVMYKFRTMSDARDSHGELLPDELRLGRVGRLLRSTSLDELPSLWNVLMGDMSLVGPRPLLVEYLPLYSAEQARRHEVLPGLTGLAQVNGRNAIKWKDKLALDVEYVERRSLLLDAKIMLMTLSKVVRRDGVAMDGYVSAPFFTGDPDM